ncbi:MAG: phage terminase small subunit P27 family [Hafnia alvei]|jgi:P27 family predicted phage terminase small subunit|uniref:Phage terminase, small subunit n=2 Tax=Hafnia alvei TaxID=569 RepID=A0A377PKD3_HAFAL|nr:phage terminase small subunit P27 family [Hafnia alvei]KKF38700.1 terminase [Hafnia alvei]MBW3477617.1 phage terminase small subunit P27 family [Hafnia alvei]MDU3157513.1 phage terminase small subunit P27 family [Hafnia alvei]RLR07846.1 phage terminase small subunit P27 family [Hafnia alvei ATCC 13337]TBM18897.1 phage terminase small subunit P27 family [Hafnia alvei]
MSGPPKTPTHLRLVKGNPSKRAINKNEPKPPSGVPPIPKHFDKRGKYWFKRMGEELDAVGVMSTLDAKALELLVEAYTEYRHHCEVLDEEGYTYQTGSATGEKIVKAHPAAAMKADAWKRIRAMLSEFGMTPASRSKVEIKAPAGEDPFAEFLKARD